MSATLLGEPPHLYHLAGFVLIWVALAIYSAESLWRLRRGSTAPA